MPITKLGAVLDALDQPSSVTGEVLIGVALGVPGVEVPEGLTQGVRSTEGTVTLKYSHRHRPPPDVGHRGIKATLTRGGVAYDTFVPWSAVFALREEASGTVIHWLVNVPEEGPEGGPGNDKPKKSAGHLRLV